MFAESPARLIRELGETTARIRHWFSAGATPAADMCITWPWLQRRGLLYAGTIRNWQRFGGKEKMPMPKAASHSDTEISHGELSKIYGVDFAKGCADMKGCSMCCGSGHRFAG